MICINRTYGLTITVFAYTACHYEIEFVKNREGKIDEAKTEQLGREIKMSH